jgi:hypothetical protein
MLKILTPSVRGPSARNGERQRRDAIDVRHLHQQIAEQRDIIACGARRANVDARCRLLLFNPLSYQNTNRPGGTTAHVNRRLAGLMKTPRGE